MKYVNYQKWIACTTCEYNFENSAFQEYVCLQCNIKNEFSQFISWKNNIITKAIRDICIENGWKEFDNDEMYEELKKRNII
jgi:hypothetical protein